MSLPGLELSAPVEATLVPTIQELKEGTEWRFEVAFGTKVEVRVCNLSECSVSAADMLTTFFAAPLR